jgi:hypothetical protein
MQPESNKRLYLGEGNSIYKVRPMLSCNQENFTYYQSVSNELRMWVGLRRRRVERTKD